MNTFTNPLYYLFKPQTIDLTEAQIGSALTHKSWARYLEDKFFMAQTIATMMGLLLAAALVGNSIFGGRIEPVFDPWNKHPQIDALSGFAAWSPYLDSLLFMYCAYGLLAGMLVQGVHLLLKRTWTKGVQALVSDPVPDCSTMHPATGVGYPILVLVLLAFVLGDHNQSLWAYMLVASGVLMIFIPHIGRNLVFSGNVIHERTGQNSLSLFGEPVDADSGEVPVRPEPPQICFKDIFGMEELKARLLAAGQDILGKRKKGTAPRNGILLHGEPGNGKTVFAEALAGELGVPIIKLTYGDLSSEWLGKVPRMVKQTFSYAKRCAPCVLLVDEIDSFLRARGASNQHEEDRKVTNTLLTEIVELRRHRIILVGATNHLEAIDAAAAREGRFDFKIEVTPPDQTARLLLLRRGVAKHAKGLSYDDVDLEAAAERWNGFSVARLMAVCQALPEVVQGRRQAHIVYTDWVAALRLVQGATRGLHGQIRPLEQLILDEDNSRTLRGMVQRLRHAVDVERLGGELPHGVLFAGPPGTGKTAAAKAIAQASDWSFISIAGPDLLADRGMLQKVFNQAQHLRPAIIFVDEGDDVLRDRSVNHHADLVNKLLTLMDGTAEKVRDVLWVAATNHPDQIDPALLRAGRFTEKVIFTLPPADLLPPHIEAWLERKKVNFAPGDTLPSFAHQTAQVLAGQTVANIEGVLQQALNMAITDSNVKSHAVTLDIGHVRQAMLTVLGRE